MPQLPNFMTGLSLTQLSVQPLTADVNGTLTNNGSSVSFLTICEGYRYDAQATVESINAAANPVDNEVFTEDDDQFVLREIMRRGSNQINLKTVWENTGRKEFALITLTRHGNTTTFYACMEDYSESGGRDKWVAEVRFSMIDAGGVTNPTYA